ncbi:MAG: hypothetical protein KAV83_09095 [Desulfobacterales bacterium]|nr:hypothetical protein [Desulfobacterales bacterium]
MVFITAGLGGGTGTGAAPIIATICKEIGALTITVVSIPASFEGKKRASQAQQGINALKEVADTVITIPNDRPRGLVSTNATMLQMLKKADEGIFYSIKDISDLIMMPGLVGLDFADIRAIISNAGMAAMGTGIATGDKRAKVATENAISHLLSERISIADATGVLANIASSDSVTLKEMTEAFERIHQEVGAETEIVWGVPLDESLEDRLRVTVIATGIRYGGQLEPKPSSDSAV